LALSPRPLLDLLLLLRLPLCLLFILRSGLLSARGDDVLDKAKITL
jgi:hypothetical protein